MSVIRNRRLFTKEFKYRVIREVEAGKSLAQVDLEWPSYGYRRITHELLRRGVDVGLKTVLHLMREDNLLCLRKQRFRIATTDSDHGLPTYKNLARDLVITECDQPWGADTTFESTNVRTPQYIQNIKYQFSRRGGRINILC